MTALFISDLHLTPEREATSRCFEEFLRNVPVTGDSLYVLGDLFEYWAGDDDIDAPFHRRILGAFAAVAGRGIALYWIPGNRDFLAGTEFVLQARMTPMSEPSVFALNGVSTVLLHGDALCTDDHAYQSFRTEVRSARWRREFLARPLAERRAEIEIMRQRSAIAKAGKAATIMDVNASAVAKLFNDTGADRMIHGHTHRPARHDYMMFGRQTRRWVLPAWDASSAGGPGYLRVDATGAEMIYLS